MRKQIINFFVVAALCACPVLASAYEFGVVDTSQIFSKYKVTQKTKETLETKKTELQKDLENRKEDVKKIDDEYVSVAKQLQDLRDSKKDKEAKALETKLADLRKSLAQKSGDLQKFFEESQRALYALEEKEMSGLAKDIEVKVDVIVAEMAKKNKLKAVFAKGTTFWIDEKIVYDMTAEVIKTLNAGK